MSNKKKNQSSILNFLAKNENVHSDDQGIGEAATQQDDAAGVRGQNHPVLAAEVVEVQGEAVGGEVVQTGDKQGQWAKSREVMSIAEICQNVDK